MKFNNILYSILGIGLILGSCEPKIEDKVNLPAPIQASMDVQKLIDPQDSANINIYTFKNTSPSGFVIGWDFGGLGKSAQQLDTFFFAYKGTYKVILRNASKGGISTVTRDIVIETNSPYAADFTLTKGNNDFNYSVVATTPNPRKTFFTFPNGDTTSNPNASFYWPWKGSFDVTLTTTASNNLVSTINKKITIPSDDPTNPYLNDPIINLLTGGINMANGKTWVINPGKLKTNVGPANNLSGSYYNFPDGLTGPPWVAGALNNEYTFTLRNFKYSPKNNNVTAAGLFATKYLNMPGGVLYTDYALADPKHAPANFIVNKDSTNLGTGYGFAVTNGSYIGYFENRYKYYIVRINADTMYLAHRYTDQPADNPAADGNARYFTFVAKK